MCNWSCCLELVIWWLVWDEMLCDTDASTLECQRSRVWSRAEVCERVTEMHGPTRASLTHWASHWRAQLPARRHCSKEHREFLHFSMMHVLHVIEDLSYVALKYQLWLDVSTKMRYDRCNSQFLTFINKFNEIKWIYTLRAFGEKYLRSCWNLSTNLNSNVSTDWDIAEIFSDLYDFQITCNKKKSICKSHGN